jgi:hypothetical protein
VIRSNIVKCRANNAYIRFVNAHLLHAYLTRLKSFLVLRCFCAGSRVDAGVEAKVVADEGIDFDILLEVSGAVSGVAVDRAVDANRIRQCKI